MREQPVMKGDFPHVSEGSPEFLAVPPSVLNSGLDIEVCLKCMEIWRMDQPTPSRAIIDQVLVSKALPIDAIRIHEEFWKLYQTDSKTQLYFDELYKQRANAAIQAKKLESAEKNGFGTVEEHEASLRRKAFEERKRKLEDAIQALLDSGVQAEAIERICKGAMEKK